MATTRVEERILASVVNPAWRRLEHLCAELTATETRSPGTELRLTFEPVGSTSLPRDQES